jgi:hypothetical protein
MVTETNHEPLSEPKSKQLMGVASSNVSTGIFKSGEFLPELRGTRAITKYREMRDNSAVIGAVLYAVEQVLRDVALNVVPADKSDAAVADAKFVEECLNDMEHSLDDHVSEAVSFLWMGFSWFEVVYKRREGLDTKNVKKRSKYNDGRIGVRKLVSRAPWTISKFAIEPKTGKILGVHQRESAFTGRGSDSLIPSNKSIYYRTTAIDGDPSGRSILRNAYTSYTYLTNLQSIEAIAVEREMHGIPIGRIPSEYLAATATDAQVAIRLQMERMLADMKLNAQGYALLPSDLLLDSDGKSTGGVAARLVDVELMTSQGNRNIDIGPIIDRYQHDIARSVLSEFLMLGTNGGSYALSKSKTDLFLRALESYINTVADVLNKQLVEPLWELNGLSVETMPRIEAGDVAPHDLRELGSYLRNLNGANIDLSDEPDVINALLQNAELPQVDPDKIMAKAEERKELEKSKVAAKEKPAKAEAPKSRKEVLEEEVLQQTLEVLKNDSLS